MKSFKFLGKQNIFVKNKSNGTWEFHNCYEKFLKFYRPPPYLPNKLDPYLFLLFLTLPSLPYDFWPRSCMCDVKDLPSQRFSLFRQKKKMKKWKERTERRLSIKGLGDEILFNKSFFSQQEERTAEKRTKTEKKIEEAFIFWKLIFYFKMFQYFCFFILVLSVRGGHSSLSLNKGEFLYFTDSPFFKLFSCHLKTFL